MLLSESVPGIGADDVDIRGVLVLGVGVGGNQVLMPVDGQGELCVLRAVHDALLQRGIGLAGGHGDRGPSHQADHLHGCGAWHGADLPGAVCVVPDGDKALIGGGVEQLLDRLAVLHGVVVVLLALKQIGDGKDAVAVVKLPQCVGADLCHIQDSGLYHLDLLVL